jgi:hypothetical protein
MRLATKDALVGATERTKAALDVFDQPERGASLALARALANGATHAHAAQETIQLARLHVIHDLFRPRRIWIGSGNTRASANGQEGFPPASDVARNRSGAYEVAAWSCLQHHSRTEVPPVFYLQPADFLDGA